MTQLKGIGSSAVVDALTERTGRDVSAATSKSPASTQVTRLAASSTQLSTASLLTQQSAGSDDVRHERVAQVKASLDASRYSITASAVAGKLMESMFS